MIDPNDLGLAGVLSAIAAIVGGVVLAGLLIAFAVARFAGRPRASSICFGLVASVALLVDVVVVSRASTGEVTVWDALWAVGLTSVAFGLWRATALATRSLRD